MGSDRPADAADRRAEEVAASFAPPARHPALALAGCQAPRFPGRARIPAAFGSGRKAGGAAALHASRRQGPRTPLAVTPREAPARRVTAAEGGLRAAPHTGRSRAKPGLARAVPFLSLAARAARGRLPALRGRAAALRLNVVRAAPKAAYRGSGPAARPSRGRVLRPSAAANARHVACTETHAPRRAVSAPAGPARQLKACHGVCEGRAPRARHTSRHARRRRGPRRRGPHESGS